MEIKPGDKIAVRIRKITYKGGDWVYLTLELPGIEHPYTNYPTLRVFIDKLDEIKPLRIKEEGGGVIE